MRLERLTYNKIKVFLTIDDLLDRGLKKDDLWHNAPKVQELFQDMMDEASLELGFEADGPIAVEVFSLQAQGMVVIVTKESSNNPMDDELLDEYIEMQVTLDESEDVFYEFNSLEDLLSLSKRLSSLGMTGGSLYFYNNCYYTLLNEDHLEGFNIENVIAILAEYGNPSTLTTYRVGEYGKLIMSNNAIQQINYYFN
ncbi:genetic competence negative regulator [Bacillus salitolerans]|uniref:Adapter protein MecA n=1 Tax=Bacillus salitolerans TaxID=1437434 RepID=A0ABW4LVY3_9BACI